MLSKMGMISSMSSIGAGILDQQDDLFISLKHEYLHYYRLKKRKTQNYVFWIILPITTASIYDIGVFLSPMEFEQQILRKVA